jgi:hypothetical protein
LSPAPWKRGACQSLAEADLRFAGHPLALVAAEVPSSIAERVFDLCDAAELVRLGLRPDEPASANRRKTQAIAAGIHASGYAGLRWWSALGGDWYILVLFRDRLDSALAFWPAPAADARPPGRAAGDAVAGHDGTT